LSDLRKITKTCLSIKYKGSYTVEISLIMPIVLGVIFVCIYLCFFVHDRAVMEYACTKSLLEAERYSEPVSDYDLEQIIESELIKGLAGRWDYTITIAYDNDCVEIVLNGKMGESLKLPDVVADSGLFGIEVHRKGSIKPSL